MDKQNASKTKSIAFIGLFIALIAVCSWITVPIGPIPFTMQMFAIPLMISLLSFRNATVAIYCYVILGAIGAPMFSGMRGGIGVVLGPTGGFILGYLIAVPVACALLYWMEKVFSAKIKSKADSCADDSGIDVRKTSRLYRFASRCGCSVIVGIVFTCIAYATGCIQYMIVGNVSLEAALVTSVLPFIIPDIVKVILASVCAVSVKSALGMSLVPEKKCSI